MKLVKSIDIEEYIKRHKKEAENEFPNIIRRLLQNTVSEITELDIPVGDNTIQTGFDGRITFTGNNKYLGNKPCNIEIGTNADYVNKANKDISKRKVNSKENYIFFTPFRWNKKKPSKDEWIREKKKKYKWNDIKVIDASTLENWLEEDYTTSKYILDKIGIPSDNIFSIDEKEVEYINKTKKHIKLDFFDYEDEQYEELLSQLNKEYYNIVAPTREEGLYVTLYYLKKLKKTDTLIIEDEQTWKKIISGKRVANAILIPNFHHNDGLETLNNNTTIFIYDSEELTKECDYEIKQRTVMNLRKSLEKYYKDEQEHIDNEYINLLIEKSLGKYIPLKREIFKEMSEPAWYKQADPQLYLHLFFINSFKTSDMNLFEQFGTNENELKLKLQQMVKEKDPFIVYYKYKDEYKVVNMYNAIYWLGDFIQPEDIENLCIVAKKILFYLEPNYWKENINKPIYIEGVVPREYSKEVKEGVLKGFIITKLYLQNKGKYDQVKKMDEIIDEYYNSITEEGQFLSFANISDMIVEYDYDKYLAKIKHSTNNKNFIKLFNLKNKDSLFSTYEYCKILYGIEKALTKEKYIVEAVETLALLCEMKDTYYKNMANTPLNTLKKVFIGWDNLTCLNINEKIKLLKKLIEKHKNLGKKLLQELLPSHNSSWTQLRKPDFDTYDDITPIKYVSEQIEYFENYYEIYIKNYANKLLDLVCIYEEVYFIDFNCADLIKDKTLELVMTSDDEDKFALKKVISERLRGYNHFQNTAWHLTEKQLNFLNYVQGNIKYQNLIYDYVYTYQYHPLMDEKELKKERLNALKLVKDNKDSENILLKKCDNKIQLVKDIYNNNHNKKCNIEFLKKLFDKHFFNQNTVIAYLNEVYSNEPIEHIIQIYNNKDIQQIPAQLRILILSQKGYDNKIYKKIKGTKEEKLYWETLNTSEGEKNDFVYNSCLKYKNYTMCLEMIYNHADEYEKKCTLLETMKKENYKPAQFDEYMIQRIFQSFYNDTKIKNYERIAMLEIYYNPILDGKIYFLSREASKTPRVVAELAEFAYKSDDDTSSESGDIQKSSYNCYYILHNLKIHFEHINCKKWCDDFIDLMKKKNRTKIMYTLLGQLLARTGNDTEDGMYPSKKVRKVIEQYHSEQLSRSFEIEKYNSRGVHYIGTGEEEYTLYKQYLNWAKQMRLDDYPETAKILDSIAQTYKEESEFYRENANYVL